VKGWKVFIVILAPAALAPAMRGANPQDANGIVSRSVEHTEADWNAAPQYTFREHDDITKGGRREVRDYQVIMLEGSPYDKLIAKDGKPLNSAEGAEAEEKLKRETQRRRSESPQARAKRIAQYNRERHQDHALLREMIASFVYRLAGTESMNGRTCFRIDASPKPGYVPKSRETKVLTGMRGTLWIDTSDYQWVKVAAEVFRPVAFGLFVAHVEPGTEFVLEQAPEGGGLWLPSHFLTKVNAKVLVWTHNSVDDETYSHYEKIPAANGTPTVDGLTQHGSRPPRAVEK